MALTEEMLIKCVQEYYTDPMQQGYYTYGNMITGRNDVVFYAPQILALCNDPVVRYIYQGTCSCNGANFLRVELPSRTSVVFEGIEGAPNKLTLEDLQQVYHFFMNMNPDLVNPWLDK
jgi:hypothetical protein